MAAKHLANLGKQGDLVLVDLGCGTKPYQPVFQRFVAQYIGIDLLGNGAADYYADIDGMTGLQSGCADVVLSTQVMEHMPQPDRYLRECYRLLKPGSLLILSTHGYWKYHPDPQDYWRWTSEGLKKTVMECSFEIVDFVGLMGLGATSLHLAQDALMPSMPVFLRSLFAFLMQRLVIAADKLHSAHDKSRDACIFLVVAKKKVEPEHTDGH